MPYYLSRLPVSICFNHLLNYCVDVASLVLRCLWFFLIKFLRAQLLKADSFKDGKLAQECYHCYKKKLIFSPEIGEIYDKNLLFEKKPWESCVTFPLLQFVFFKLTTKIFFFGITNFKRYLFYILGSNLGGKYLFWNRWLQVK